MDGRADLERVYDVCVSQNQFQLTEGWGGHAEFLFFPVLSFVCMFSDENHMKQVAVFMYFSIFLNFRQKKKKEFIS